MTGRYTHDTKGTELIQEFASHIKGKVVLTTGVSPGGLGAFFVESIAKAQPKLLILAGRSLEKTQATEKKIKEANPDVATRSLKLDLASFQAVRDAAKEINEDTDVPYIDVLVNNAGIMAQPYQKTGDGFESQWQSNHLSHFLFTNLIIDKILASAAPRVVVVSSDGYRLGHVRHFDYNFHDGESYNTWAAYGQSKTGNNLFARELANRLGKKGLVSVSIHPGVIASNLGSHLNDELLGKLVALDKSLGNANAWSEFDMVSLDQGTATHVFAAFSPEVKDFNGAYLEKLDQIPFPEAEIHPWAVGDLEAGKVWRLSEEHVGQKFDY